MTHHPSGGPSTGAHPAETFDLHISNPPGLLNEIARRYESLLRIILEYPDNALDDAEELHRAADGYPYLIRIEVVLDPSTRTVTIRDNCRGMPRETLERIVRNVGESAKRGVSWLNGQFGFGVHAFRAAADTIRFRTKQAGGPHLELTLHRDQYTGIRRPYEISGSFPTDTGTGTELVIGPIDPDWFEEVTGEDVRREIELHFERLLARPNLEVTVQENGNSPLRCQPFDYSSVPGTEFQRKFSLKVRQQLYPVEVQLKVTEVEFPSRSARFFARGRRINEVARIGSFVRKSQGKVSLWGHPHLVGFIEVGEAVQPMITRDEFKRDSGRGALYRAMLKLESDIQTELEKLDDARRVVTLNRLENVLRDILDDLARQDRIRLRTEIRAGGDTGQRVDGGAGEGDEDGGPHRVKSKEKGGAHGGGGDLPDGPDNDSPGHGSGPKEGGHQLDPDLPGADGQKRKRSGFDIQFMSLPPDSEGRVRRSLLLEGTLVINTEHPDFQERIKHTRHGRPKVTPRLCAYLAAVISAHYKDQFYLQQHRQPDRAQLFEDQVDFICRFESALLTHRAEIEQTMASEAGEEAEDEQAA